MPYDIIQISSMVIYKMKEELKDISKFLSVLEKGSFLYKDECVLALNSGKSLDDYEFISYSQERLNSDIKKHEYLFHWEKVDEETWRCTVKKEYLPGYVPELPVPTKEQKQYFLQSACKEDGALSVFTWYGNKNHRVPF